MIVKRNLTLENRYVVYKSLASMWFVGAVWLFYYRLFLSDYQVGWLDAASFGVGLLFEIPSGALADHFGRKRIAITGGALISFGFILQGLAPGYEYILIGNIISAIGMSFRSGSDDALFYDVLNYKPNSYDWRVLVSRATRYSTLAYAPTILIGGFLYKLDPGLPFVAGGIAIGLSTTVLVAIKDHVKPRKLQLKQAMIEYRTNVRQGVTHMFSRKVVAYVPIIICLQGFYFTFGVGLLMIVMADNFGVSAQLNSNIVSLAILIGFLLQRYQENYFDKVSEKLALTGFAVVTVAGLLLSSAPIGYLGILVIIVYKINESLIQPWISDAINKHAVPDQRATIISAASFMKSVSYVVVAPVIGYLNGSGHLNYYLIFSATLIVASQIFYLKRVV